MPSKKVKKLALKAGKKGLAGALARHRLDQEAVTSAVPKPALKKKHKQVHANQKGLMPFTLEDRVLLVGEGDFGYALLLVQQGFVEPERLVATAYDDKEGVVQKYPATAATNLEQLEQLGVAVRFLVDATSLPKLLGLKKSSRGMFSSGLPTYVVFNFPHTGLGMADVDRNIREHQKLMLGFFRLCRQLAGLQGEDAFGGYGVTQPLRVALTLFEGEPYVLWEVKRLGRLEGFRVERSGRFEWAMFPEYHHRRTDGEGNTTVKAENRAARMYVYEMVKQEA